MKIHPMGAKLFYEVRRTDMTKLTVTFRHFANTPKNTYVNTHIHPYQSSKHICIEVYNMI
jgi:hypothetical protein